MLRPILIILALIALIWMILPMIHEQGTEIAFAAGDPDPNVYKTAYLFGWPLTWIAWERSWNEAAGYDEAGVESLSVVNLVIHVSAIAIPLALYSRLRRSRSPVESNR